MTTFTARQETEGDHDDKRRVDEPDTSLSPVAQNEAPVLDPVSPDMKTREDEIAGRCFMGSGANAAKKTNQRFLAPGRSHQQHVGLRLDCNTVVL